MVSDEKPINPYRVYGDLMQVLDLQKSFVTHESGNTRDQLSTVFDTLIPRGSSKTAREEKDFVTSTDPWFRPVDLLHGPDGALYITTDNGSNDRIIRRMVGPQVPSDSPRFFFMLSG